MGKRLTENRVRKLQRPGVYGDGGRGSYGLQLRLHRTKTGHVTKSWRQSLRIHGRKTGLGLGSWPFVSLDDARGKCIENIIEIRQGNDPRQRHRAPQVAPVAPAPAPAAVAPVPTLEDAIEAVIELRRDGWKAGGGTEARWRAETGAIPFAAFPISSVSSRDILSYLSPIWTKRHDAAKRRLTIIKAAMQWAIVSGHIQNDPTASLKSVLKPVKNGQKHHESLPHAEVAEALHAVRKYSSQPRTRRETGMLLEFLILTGTRTGEAAGADWSEIDGKTWTIPADRTKTGVEHRVPLSSAAFAVLEEARATHGGTGIIFPARNGGPIKASSTGAMLRASGVNAVPHGFRSSFRSWAADNAVSHDVGEACLGHRTGNAVSQAYQRSDLLERRRPVLEAWARHATR